MDSKKISVKRILNGEFGFGRIVELKGWVKSHRAHGQHISFIALNDGSTHRNLQVIYKKPIQDIPVGSAIAVAGEIAHSPGEGQNFELQAETVEILKEAKDYPIQKKDHSFEWMREVSHVRHRTGIFTCVNIVKDVLYGLVNDFFRQEEFKWIQAPIITNNSCEGGAGCFAIKDSEQFFRDDALLTVSGQFHAEAMALGLKKVYTFGPTFRAEKSNTTSHLAEFWMIEPELHFCNLEEIMELMEKFIRYTIKGVLEKCSQEIEYLSEAAENEESLLTKLQNVLESPYFERLEYGEAINLLLKNGVEVHFGDDLSTEQEKLILKKVGGPVFIYNFPKEIKSFYMRGIDDTVVSSVDLLMPGVGELMGGSEREVARELLEKRAQECGITLENLQWYVDLRDHGFSSSAGFGCGFERLMLYVTGLKNIRDVVNFHRSYGQLKY